MHHIQFMIHRARVIAVIALLLQIAALAAAQTSQPTESQAVQPLRFSVTYDESITDSFTGYVYIMLSLREGREPRFGPSWFNPEPFFSTYVTDWKPGQTLFFDDKARGFPDVISTLSANDYQIQAVLRTNLDSPEIGTSAGTAYSSVIRRSLNGISTGTIELNIDQRVPPKMPSPEIPGVKRVHIRSELLSAFHGRDIYHDAALLLPDGYDADDSRKYPALYCIGGFGSNENNVLMWRRFRKSDYSNRMVRIGLDPICRTGHHVFADSANNGPVGQALIEELIPYLEHNFRLVSADTARFLTGPSSGGWSSLWLQVTYPETFGGVWSFCPDPVDFRSFQYINLYEPGANMYRNESNERRPLARFGDEPALWYDDFARMDWVIAEGGQLASFEAVFSPKDKNGHPQLLFDRETGEVDPAVAEAWKAYDIQLILEENWDELEPILAGKINVFMGELDTFYLEGAAILLKASLETMNRDAIIEIHPGKNHGSIVSRELLIRMDRELIERFETAHPEFAHVEQKTETATQPN